MLFKQLIAPLISVMLMLGISANTVADGQAKTIKVGVLATLEGPYTALGEDGVRGIKVAMKQFDAKAGGKDVQIVVASTDASPDSAISAVRRLVEKEKVDIVIGPVSGSEGIALRDYSKSQPHVTFLNGSSAAQETTLVTPSANFFRFTTEGAQWQAGLGEYVYKTKGYRKVATIGDDVLEVIKKDDDNLATKLVLKKDNVDQQLGIPAAKFKNLGLPSRENPVCKSPMGGS